MSELEKPESVHFKKPALEPPIHGLMDSGFMLFHPGFVAIAHGHVPAGLMLSNAVVQQVLAEAQGEFEWRCSMQGWMQRLGLGYWQIKTGVRDLRSLNVLSAARTGNPPGRIYSLEWDVFEPLWLEITGLHFRDWYSEAAVPVSTA